MTNPVLPDPTRKDRLGLSMRTVLWGRVREDRCASW